MQSNNPVFRNSDEFKANNAYGNPTYAGNGSAYPNYGAAPVGDPLGGATYSPGQTGARMTVDSVVQKTALTIGLAIVAAVITWVTTPALDSQEAFTQLYLVAMVGSGIAFVLSMVNSFKRVISPALVLVFAAAQGVALGALSKSIDTMVEINGQTGGIVIQAVIGTFFAFFGTLAAYKFFNIKVSSKFQRFVIAAMFGMVGLGLMELVLSLFGASTGLFGFGALGLLTAVAGLVLGVFMLILDFDFVEQGVANGLPERESWRAAFALTVSLVWIYTNLLRLLAIINQR